MSTSPLQPSGACTAPSSSPGVGRVDARDLGVRMRMRVCVCVRVSCVLLAGRRGAGGGHAVDQRRHGSGQELREDPLHRTQRVLLRRGHSGGHGGRHGHGELSDGAAPPRHRPRLARRHRAHAAQEPPVQVPRQRVRRARAGRLRLYRPAPVHRTPPPSPLPPFCASSTALAVSAAQLPLDAAKTASALSVAHDRRVPSFETNSACQLWPTPENRRHTPERQP